MTSNMVERVARAMGDTADAYAAGEGCDDLDVLDADLLLELAAAAIATLTEPTEAMLDRGYHESGPIDGAIAYAVVGQIWRAMIAVALDGEAK